MKKILIISYFFPPSNFVGASRTAAWAKYLFQNGYFPIIITRQWNEGQTDLTDKVINNQFSHEKHPNYEVYRLPYKRSLRDKLASFPFLKPFQKSLTFLELILSNFFIKALPFANFYDFSKTLIHKDPTIKLVIASGRPFHSFFIGHKLKTEFENITWIPDYRDEWSTHQKLKPTNFLQKLIFGLEKSSEKKWTSNCKFFLTVSDTWKDTIQGYIKKPGFVVMNGYEDSGIDLIHIGSQNQTNTLTITYSGTIYPYQNIEIFINACKCIINSGKRVIVKFIGANIIPQEEKRLKRLVIGYEDYFLILDRIPKKELLKHELKSDLLLLTGYTGFKGWYPVKLFEYYATQKPMLLCPSDHDVIEAFFKQTNCGYIADTNEECERILTEIIQKKERGTPIERPHDNELAHFFSREHQTKILAEILSLHIK